MDELGAEEVRVLGCLVEKDHTTPEQYPLTMNALLMACNQASNRTPVVAYDVDTVEIALGMLRQQGLARVLLSSSNRATKYRHVLDEHFGMTDGEVAVLAVLFLRGPQTVNELRTRTERYRGLADLGGVEAVLDRLATRYSEPYVRRLDRLPGQREERWAHLFSGEPSEPLPGIERPPPARSGAAERLATIEADLSSVREEVAELRREVAELRELLS
jgi:uncharacterized protein YceH (UPF0502 family)